MVLKFVTAAFRDAALLGLKQALEIAGLTPEEAGKNFKSVQLFLQAARDPSYEDGPPRVEKDKTAGGDKNREAGKERL